jgi:tRNA/rRNA methyltransferase
VNATLQPAIILVRPQLGENIGKAARAMLNFGLTDMRIVAPRDGWPNPSAGPAAAGADTVLNRARIYDSTAAAVADCRHVFATTVRKRGVHKAVLSPEVAMRDAVGFDYQIGILFGPERSGLASEDVDLARTILTVPVNPEFGSLNLAQAVLLVAYEWSRARSQPLAMPTRSDQSSAPATQADLEGLVAHLESALEGTRFFYPEDRLEATKRTLRSVLTRPGWNAEEVQILRGVIASLVKKRRQQSVDGD